jgi:hypothetical protein
MSAPPEDFVLAPVRGQERVRPTSPSVPVIHLWWELSYDDLEGTVSQAHIHFGQKAMNGSIVVCLCQTAGTPALLRSQVWP